MTSGDYWAKRMERVQEQIFSKSDEYRREQLRLIRLQQDKAQRTIDSFFAKFAKNNKISLADARQILTSKERAAYQIQLDEYMRLASQWDADTNNALRQRIENASIVARLSRQEALYTSISAEIGEMAARMDKGVADVVADTVEQAYYRTTHAIQTGTGLGVRFDRLDPATREVIAAKPWTADGKAFSDRIWGNAAQLQQSLEQHMTRLFAGDATREDVIRALTKEFGADSKPLKGFAAKAARLVDTECAAYSAQAQRKAYADQGVEWYEFVVTFDAHTCDSCEPFDGMVFKTAEMQSGVNAQPIHPHCRCTTAPSLDPETAKEYEEIDAQTDAEMRERGEQPPERTRVARNPETGESYSVPADMTYREWYEKYVSKGAGAKSEEKVAKLLDFSRERGIIGNADDNTRGLAMGLRTPPSHILTEDEIALVLREAQAIGVDTSILKFNEGNRTGYFDSDRTINIRGDVLPDLYSISAHNRDYLSVRAVLAHEYYGHYANRNSNEFYRPNDWRDEFRASYEAAVNAPNLTDVDRAMLMRDAYDRALEAGATVEFTDEARRILYGSSYA
ncbi:MAG: minor capsid protein [Clostridium sp.]|nr:minor capsid protein [Clostridium sp.]